MPGPSEAIVRADKGLTVFGTLRNTLKRTADYIALI